MLVGGPRKLYVNDSHRKRKARSNGHNPDIGADDPDANTDIPAVEPGRCRAGLDSWLEGRESSLAASLVAAARSLADEVDADPSSSPLWGRYSTLLGQLTEHHLDVDTYGLRRAEQAVAWVNGGEARCTGCERIVHSCPYCSKTRGQGVRVAWAEPVHPDDAYPEID